MFSLQIIAQKHNCCKAVDQFAALSDDAEFRDAHQLPGDFKLENPQGSMIRLELKDGSTAAAYYIGTKDKSNKYIFVFHEWWGLNDYVKNEAERLFKQLPGVNVLAFDLYDGKVATTREKASEYMQSVDNQRALEIIDAGRKMAGENAKIGTIGWCFGGGWSLQASLALGKNAVACVMYYGMPEKDLEVLKKLNAPVLGIFATQDNWINPDVVKEFYDNMNSVGKSIEIHSFEAAHAFANPSNRIYDAMATEMAWKTVIRFFTEQLVFD
jgi:carboxymethylenebutenolidase